MTPTETTVPPIGRVVVHRKVTTHCVQCDLTEKHLSIRSVPFVSQPIDTPEAADTLTAFKDRGILGAPVTVFYDEAGAEIAAFGGFQPAAIDALVRP